MKIQYGTFQEEAWRDRYDDKGNLIGAVCFCDLEGNVTTEGEYLMVLSYGPTAFPPLSKGAQPNLSDGIVG